MTTDWSAVRCADCERDLAMNRPKPYCDHDSAYVRPDRRSAMSTDLEDFRFGLVLLEYDWLVNDRAQRLHHATLTDEQVAYFADSSQLDGATVRLTCGRRLFWPSTPGVVSREGMRRCHACCVRVGYHDGVGSPQNDPLLQPLAKARINARLATYERTAA